VEEEVVEAVDSVIDENVEEIGSIDDIFSIQDDLSGDDAGWSEVKVSESENRDDFAGLSGENEALFAEEAIDISSQSDDNDNTPFIEEADSRTITDPADSLEAGAIDTTVDSAIDIDDDFRNMLLNEISKGSKPRSQQKLSNIEYSSDAQIPSSDEDPLAAVQFGEVDDLENAFAEKEVSWDSETDKIKTRKNVNKKNKNADKNNKTKEKPKKMTEKEERNNKKTFALIIAIIIIAMILVIGGVIGYFYLDSKSNIPVDTPTDSTEVIPNDALIQDTTQTDEESILTDTTIIEDTPAEDTTISIPPPEEPKKEIPPPQTITPPAPPKQTPQQPKTTQPTTTQPKQTTPKKTTPPKDNTIKDPIYTIQIYSSPSKSDSEERLTMLERKGIKGFVSTQQIKGQT